MDDYDGDDGSSGDDDEFSPVVRPIHPRASIATRLLTWKVSCSGFFLKKNFDFHSFAPDPGPDIRSLAEGLILAGLQIGLYVPE